MIPLVRPVATANTIWPGSGQLIARQTRRKDRRVAAFIDALPLAAAAARLRPARDNRRACRGWRRREARSAPRSARQALRRRARSLVPTRHAPAIPTPPDPVGGSA